MYCICVSLFQVTEHIGTYLCPFRSINLKRSYIMQFEMCWLSLQDVKPSNQLLFFKIIKVGQKKPKTLSLAQTPVAWRCRLRLFVQAKGITVFSPIRTSLPRFGGLKFITRLKYVQRAGRDKGSPRWLHEKECPKGG